MSRSWTEGDVQSFKSNQYIGTVASRPRQPQNARNFYDIGLISIFLTVIGLIPNTTPVVTIEDGQLQGRTAYSRDGKEYLEYLAIPYAEPPIGDLRFEAPVPLKQKWKDVKQMTRYPPHCLQFDSFFTGRLQGSEDCLYLNVFTHDVTPEKKKPVLVYIHGGGFMTGASSMYGPSYLMNEEDIVLVTMNYRLGPLGFMNTGDELIRGNMGLKDQNLALKWVQRNIAQFGGNPSQVTLFGESAGAASVHYHMLSPSSQGLFHKALAQSGVAIAPWAFEREPKKVTMNYVKAFDCPRDNMEALVQCLKKMDGKELVKPQISTMTPTNEFLIFVPSIEAVIRDDTFLSKDPEVILKSGKFAKVPLMLGVVSGEGGLKTGRFEAMPELIPEIDKNWEQSAHVVLCHKDLKGKTEDIRNIRAAYFGNNSFTENLHDFKKNLIHLVSDGMFFEPTHTAAKIHAKQGVQTYLYYFDYDSSSMLGVYSVVRAIRPDDWLPSELKIFWTYLVDTLKKNFFGGEGPHDFDATHANDLMQIWDMDGITSYLLSKDDIKFSRSLVKTIVDYARDLESLSFDGVKWPPIQAGDEGNWLKYMLLDKTGKIIDEPFAGRMAFWESLRQKLNSK